LLLLVNSWDKFEFIADHPQCEAKGDFPATLYTEKKGRNKKMWGWSQEGIANFNHLCDCVVKDKTAFLKFHTNEQLRIKAGIIASEACDGEETEQIESTVQPSNAYNQLKEMCDQESKEDDNDSDIENMEAM